MPDEGTHFEFADANDEVPSSGMMHFQNDDVGWDNDAADPPPVFGAHRQTNRLRIGPVVVPMAVVSVGMSVVTHAAVIAIGLLIIWQFVPASPLVFGDGAAELGLFHDGDDDAAGLQSISVQGEPPPMLAPTAPTLAPPDAAEAGDAPTTFDGGSASQLIAMGPSPKRAAFGAGEASLSETAGKLRVAQPPPIPQGTGSATSDAAPAGSTGTPGSPEGTSTVGLVKPAYPYESRRRGEEGTVVLKVEIHPDGTAGKIEVEQNPGFPRLVKAAIVAARRSKFPSNLPYRRVPYIFSLK